MLPADFFMTAKAFVKNEDRRSVWMGELARGMTARVAAMLSGKAVKPKDVWPMPWDEGSAPKFDINAIPQEERARQVAQLMRDLNGK